MENPGTAEKFEFPNLFFWTLAHTIAFPVSFFFGFVSIYLLSFIGELLPEIVASGLGYVLWGGIFGGILGVVQWSFLKKKVPIPAKWALYSLLGIGVAEAVGVSELLILDIDRNIDIAVSYGWLVWTLVYFAGGALTGYFQSSCLKKITPHYRSWILGSALSWGLSTLLWTGIIRFVTASLAIPALISGGLVLGLLSAFFLNRILKKVIN